MSLKEFLSQAYLIDQQINSRLEKLKSFQDFVTKVNPTLNNVCASNEKQRQENIVVKIIDLENEINNNIKILIDLKRKIIFIIKKVDVPEYKTLLELRYLFYKSWEQISVEMNCELPQIYKLHKHALENLQQKF